MSAMTVSVGKYTFRVVRFVPNSTRTGAVVTIAFDKPQSSGVVAIEQLKTPTALQLALGKASQEGLSNPGLVGFPKTYAVNEKGEPLQDTSGGIADWYCDVNVIKKPV